MEPTSLPRRARMAFVGCGAHANNKLYPALKLIDEIDLVAACDVAEDKLADTAARWGIAKTYTTVDELLDHEDLDAVIICGPPAMQVGVAAACIEAGKPIYVEKPSAKSAADAQELADFAREKGVKGICGFMKRYSHAYRVLKDVLARESFGPVRVVETTWTQGHYPALWGIAEPMRAFLIGQLVHMFDITRFLAGNITHVHARLTQVEPGRGAYAINCAFESGAVGTLMFSSTSNEAWHVGESVRLSGDLAWVEARDQNHVTWHPLEGWLSDDQLSRDSGGKRQTLEWRAPHILKYETHDLGGYVGELRDLARIALTDAQPLASLQDSADALRLSEAVWESATTGRDVEVSRSGH